MYIFTGERLYQICLLKQSSNSLVCGPGESYDKLSCICFAYISSCIQHHL